MIIVSKEYFSISFDFFHYISFFSFSGSFCCLNFFPVKSTIPFQSSSFAIFLDFHDFQDFFFVYQAWRFFFVVENFQSNGLLSLLWMVIVLIFRFVLFWFVSWCSLFLSHIYNSLTLTDSSFQIILCVFVCGQSRSVSQSVSQSDPIRTRSGLFLVECVLFFFAHC